MCTSDSAEARILTTNTTLVVLSRLDDESLLEDFCGSVFNLNDPSFRKPDLSRKTVYLCGDISKANCLDLKVADQVYVISELSFGYNENNNEGLLSPVSVGQVPILVQGAGVYYRRYFDPNIDHFNLFCSEHDLQSLTESTKPGTARRTGIYLTQVKKLGEDLHFHLLRCSTNLSGPTENFRANDRKIVDALNQEAVSIFENPAPLNHVLAQIYHNTPATADQKQAKARISAHADKTKDMPENGIMAFCTFYTELDKLQPLTKDFFDYGFKETSGLSRLRFRLKKSVAQNPECSLASEFTVTLYPNSVFFMPLSTNRLYTHEIQSSMLDADLLPTRLGYVVRCSNTEAIHRKGRTFLNIEGRPVELEPATTEGMSELRKLYAEENKTENFIDYGNNFLFSMNKGDYTAPQYKMADEFRSYNLPVKDKLFEELLAAVKFENVGKGRQGTVIVKPDETRGTPIVRTTTEYKAAAQHFSSVHEELAKQIQQGASLPFSFNNALVENYINAYTTMGYHSDQALDLLDGSSIALFSCYKNPELVKAPRKLVIESKESEGTTFEIPLIHNSVVVFSLDTNRLFRHKIVLDRSAPQADNQWLGITFRTSKTFVRFCDEHTYFLDDTLLTLANDDQRREFFKLRGRENRETNFTYPRITYTISKSDMMLTAM